MGDEGAAGGQQETEGENRMSISKPKGWNVIACQPEPVTEAA